MKAADLRPGDTITHDHRRRTVHRVVPGVSMGPGAPVVLVYFTTGAPTSFAANYHPRNATRQENNR